jgi:hypothetical protein
MISITYFHYYILCHARAYECITTPTEMREKFFRGAQAALGLQAPWALVLPAVVRELQR